MRKSLNLVDILSNRLSILEANVGCSCSESAIRCRYRLRQWGDSEVIVTFEYKFSTFRALSAVNQLPGVLHGPDIDRGERSKQQFQFFFRSLNCRVGWQQEPDQWGVNRGLNKKKNGISSKLFALNTLFIVAQKGDFFSFSRMYSCTADKILTSDLYSFRSANSKCHIHTMQMSTS